MAFIVEAVPIVLQWPGDGAESLARRMNSSSSISPAPSSSPRTPDDGSRSDQLAVVPAVEHRPAVQRDRRNVDGRTRP